MIILENYERKICKFCFHEFKTHKENKIYCSIDCREKNHYKNSKNYHTLDYFKEYQKGYQKKMNKNKIIFGYKRNIFMFKVKRIVFDLSLTYKFISFSSIIFEVNKRLKIEIKSIMTILFILRKLNFIEKYNRTTYKSLIYE